MLHKFDHLKLNKSVGNKTQWELLCKRLNTRLTNSLYLEKSIAKNRSFTALCINLWSYKFRHKLRGHVTFFYQVGIKARMLSIVELYHSRTILIREVKHDVYRKRQTAKMELLPFVFSSPLYSWIKIFVFAVNSKRHFNILVWFI